MAAARCAAAISGPGPDPGPGADPGPGPDHSNLRPLIPCLYSVDTTTTTTTTTTTNL